MKKLNCDTFKRMIASAANNLSNRQEEINSLNVFPVPDGDTGTNMMMTFGSGVTETLKNTSVHLGDTAKLLSKNMLMGARGNSGVILSQIFKGFANGVLAFKEADTRQIADAFLNATRVAYKAVMRPVEGTILTVIRESADYMGVFVDKNPDCDIEKYFELLHAKAKDALEYTPELLPVLKEVGVVDSGGAGLVSIFEGFDLALKGKDVKAAEKEESKKQKGYCIEAIVKLNDLYSTGDFPVRKLENSLGSNIDGFQTKLEDGKLLFRVHCQRPGEIVTILMRYGDLEKIKIENMEIGYEHTLKFDDASEKPVHEKYALVFVCNGDGIKEMVSGLHVKYFIQGGQTMNPSTQDFMEIINKIDADHIILLPNNGNIIMAAKQAKDIIRKKDITVLETKTIPQGITACINFDEGMDLQSNIDNMTAAYKNVVTGEVTFAVKDTSYNGIAIKQGNFMGISQGEILVCTDSLVETTTDLLNQIVTEDSFVTLIYGEGADKKLADSMAEYISGQLNAECEVHDGKQALYPFIIGVE
ncbi:MAG: DAK2 domain-containing protein [Erysipelotrichaceae bacterium]|nr:DAK2 domain-containing protein [Erysipelotrichaceae bacterium]